MTPLSVDELTLEQAEINISKLEFSGDRDGADDVYFEIDFPDGCFVNLLSSDEIPKLSFELPQGVYNDFRLKLKLKEEQGNEGLFLKGKVEEDDDDIISYELTSHTPLFIDERGMSINGENIIVLDADNSSTGTININSNSIFENITEDDWEDADAIEINDDNELIILSHFTNSDIQGDIIDQFESSVSIIIE